MEITQIIQELDKNKEVFRNLLSDVGPLLQSWKPGPEKWSLLEIICHLYDEEREDFRARVQHTLENPNKPIPPFDPVAWVIERQYLEQNFQKKLADFIKERVQSVQWLKTLKDPQWENIYQHPSLGPLSARLFLHNWLVHDYIHIRQILKVKYAFLDQSADIDLSYAGNW